MTITVPFALFNSKALFNPYQYKPFFKIKKDFAADFEWNGQNLFITDEVGVGKTFEAGIILQEILSKYPNYSVLILCPVKLCSNWEAELSDNFYLNFNNYWKNKQFGQLNIVPYSYFAKATQEISEAEKEEENIVENNNYENVELSSKIKDIQYDVLILDEAHYIRNGGKLWQSINQIIDNNEKENKKLKIFMTATPIFNSETDYDNITTLLKKNDQKYETTTTLQGEANCYDFLLDIQVENTSLSQDEQATLNEIEISPFGQKKGFMKRIAASSLFSLKEFIDRKISIENMTYDDEIKLDTLNSWSEEKDTKLMNLLNLLDKLQAEDKNGVFKVIIFSTFLSTCSYLERKLKTKYKVYTITGQDTPNKVRSAKINFKKEQNSTVLICSDVAKEGHNLQFCHYLIHYDFPYTPAALGQRNGRIYRKGMNQIPKVFYMHVENSYDDRLFGEIIVEKSRIIKNLSEQDKISILNVLPKDSENYIKKCLEVYFKTKVKERAGDREYTIKFEHDEFKFQLKNQFSKRINGTVVWASKEIENLYLETFHEEPGYYIALFKQVFNTQDEDMIINYYREKYEETFKEISGKIFGCETQEAFKQECDSYIEYTKRLGDYKFCHNMIEGEDDLVKYKQKFKPLIAIKGE